MVCEEREDEGLRTYKNDVCGALRTIDSCGDKRVVEIDQPKFIGNVNREDFGTDSAVQKDQTIGTGWKVLPSAQSV